MDPKTVLIVDDDEDSRSICRTLLEHKGYRVLEAGDGAEAVRLARRDAPGLVLMDVSLPALDGWAATRTLKADPATRAIRIVMLTARVSDTDRLRGQEVGCDGYLTKPCSPATILREVSRLLGPPVPLADGPGL
jgi:two-component system, cell cycle response regulator DivK